jgi:hypothetical protein
MVSGFVTSPNDQFLIVSWDANLIDTPVISCAFLSNWLKASAILKPLLIGVFY